MPNPTPKLTAAQKSKIQLEEIYRQEVRSSLTSPRASSRISKLLQFLETNTGKWLLGTVLLGLLSWVYSEIQAWIDQRDRNAIRLELVRNEIYVRVANFRYLSIDQAFLSQQSSDFSAVNQYLISAPGAREFKPDILAPLTHAIILPTFDEYSNSTFISLVAELEQLEIAHRPGAYPSTTDWIICDQARSDSVTVEGLIPGVSSLTLCKESSTGTISLIPRISTWALCDQSRLNSDSIEILLAAGAAHFSRRMLASVFEMGPTCVDF